MKKLTLLFFILLNLQWINAQNKKEYSVAILGDKYIHETDSILNRLQAEIKSVVAQEAIVIFKKKYFLINQLSQEKAKRNYQAVINAEDVDLILSFGSLNNFVIAQNTQFPKPVILFGVINDDFIEFPEGQKTSNVKNLTYILTPKSYKEDLSEFKEMYPYKKVGIIVDDYLTEIYPVKETLNKILDEINSEFKLISLSSVDELGQQLDDVDAVYISGGLFYSNEDKKKMIDIINASIMIGLLFGTVITLIFIPALYSVFYKVNYKSYQFNESLLKD
jgi:Ni,Fe-hydrogenase I large subunit